MDNPLDPNEEQSLMALIMVDNSWVPDKRQTPAIFQWWKKMNIIVEWIFVRTVIYQDAKYPGRVSNYNQT